MRLFRRLNVVMKKIFEDLTGLGVINYGWKFDDLIGIAPSFFPACRLKIYDHEVSKQLRGGRVGFCALERIVDDPGLDQTLLFSEVERFSHVKSK